MKIPFQLISPKIVPKIQLIKKGGCFEYHAVIADKIEYRYIHRDFEGLFDGGVASCEVKVNKPGKYS